MIRRYDGLDRPTAVDELIEDEEHREYCELLAASRQGIRAFIKAYYQEASEDDNQKGL